MIEALIYNILTSDIDISNYIQDRAYPAHSVQDPEYPFVTYQKISASRPLSHSGSLNRVEGVFQVSCWGSDLQQAKNVALAVVKKFHGLRDHEEILSCNIINELDLDDSDYQSYQVALDIQIKYIE